AYNQLWGSGRDNNWVSLSYDGLGRRVVESDASGLHYLIWDGDRILARGDSPADASRLQLEVSGDDIDAHVASIESLGAGKRRFYHQGPDGSVFAVSDEAGLVEGYSYSS